MPERAILVIGATGQLGTELGRCPWPGSVEPIALNSAQLDLRDAGLIPDIVARGHRTGPWAAVINAAAYTAVDRAESETAEAWRINALAPAALAEACAPSGIPLIQVSTDYVFDGGKAGPWEVDDPVGPLNVYGASKLGGEMAIRASGVRHAIVRTSWVISPHGRNFAKTMLQLAEERDRVRVVADQVGAPTSAGDLARALIAIAAAMIGNGQLAGGTYHFSNAGATNWADLAAEIFRQSSRHTGPSAIVDRITTADYPTPARRPQNSLLSHAAICRDFGIEPRHWSEALNDIVAEICRSR